MVSDGANSASDATRTGTPCWVALAPPESRSTSRTRSRSTRADLKVKARRNYMEQLDIRTAQEVLDEHLKLSNELEDR